MKLRLFIHIILFFTFTSGSAFAEIDDVTLVKKLRQGGYVILVRHAITDHSQSDMDPNNLGNCAAQRNLNQAGRDQSVAIGKAFKSLNIPAGKIYSSLYCRCIETAELAFGKPETKLGLSSFMRESEAEKTRRVNVIQRILGTHPDPKTNTILVTHSHMLHRASKIELSEGGAAVFAAQGDSQFQFIAHIPANRWQKMLNSATEDTSL